MTLGMSTIHERIHPKWLIPNKYNARMLALLKKCKNNCIRYRKRTPS